ncbi:MAG: MarR family transcriptional regulator [Bacteroidetes bacterium]|nr:MarR family transcriptional regulator [Bacteroidota bacterium]
MKEEASKKRIHLLPEQICFPMYASSRMITRLYQPLLEKLDITYPQYLVLMVLWHEEKLSITELGQRLFLNTNTLTPLIKKMKEKNLIKKQRSRSDERSVFVQLTEKGKALEEQASHVPDALLDSLKMSNEDIDTIRRIMWKFLSNFNERVQFTEGEA